MDVLYREMCQIHETVFKHQLLCICPRVPAVPAVPAKWWHEVLLGPPFHTRRGSGLREFHKLPQIMEAKVSTILCPKQLHSANSVYKYIFVHIYVDACTPAYIHTYVAHTCAYTKHTRTLTPACCPKTCYVLRRSCMVLKTHEHKKTKADQWNELLMYTSRVYI